MNGLDLIDLGREVLHLPGSAMDLEGSAVCWLLDIHEVPGTDSRLPGGGVTCGEPHDLGKVPSAGYWTYVSFQALTIEYLDVEPPAGTAWILMRMPLAGYRTYRRFPRH